MTHIEPQLGRCPETDVSAASVTEPSVRPYQPTLFNQSRFGGRPRDAPPSSVHYLSTRTCAFHGGSSVFLEDAAQAMEQSVSDATMQRTTSFLDNDGVSKTETFER